MEDRRGTILFSTKFSSVLSPSDFYEQKHCPRQLQSSSWHWKRICQDSPQSCLVLNFELCFLRNDYAKNLSFWNPWKARPVFECILYKSVFFAPSITFYRVNLIMICNLLYIVFVKKQYIIERDIVDF